jgi:hypothetical protein
MNSWATADPVDLTNRLVRFSFSSETPIQGRGHWYTLSHAEGAMNLERFERRGSLPFLINHDEECQMGDITNIWTDNRKGFALSRIWADGFRQGFRTDFLKDISQGHLKHISVRFLTVDEKLIGQRDGLDHWLVTKWKPTEISLVVGTSRPADRTVGIWD